MKRRRSLGEFEQLVLLAILQLEQEAYGPGISRILEEKAARQISRGALYSSLDRLEAKGFIEWKVERATSKRGGSRRRLFQVTRAGMEALAASREVLLNMWDGIDLLMRRSPR